MLNALVSNSLSQYLVLNWSKTRDSITKKAFKILDFSLMLNKKHLLYEP